MYACAYGCVLTHITPQEIWNVDAGHLTHKGKAAIVEDAFDDSKPNSRTASRLASRAASKAGSPASSVPPSAANSGDEAAPNGVPMPKKKKKTMTRKEKKEQEDRRRARTLAFLSNSIPGTKRESDTEEE